MLWYVDRFKYRVAFIRSVKHNTEPEVQKLNGNYNMDRWDVLARADAEREVSLNKSCHVPIHPASRITRLDSKITRMERAGSDYHTNSSGLYSIDV